MADEKISALPDGVAPLASDEFVAARAAINVRLDWSALKSDAQTDAVLDGDPAGGDLDGTYPNPTLDAIGAAAGPVGDGTHVAAVTIDTKGRVTGLASVAITGAAPTGAAGGDLAGSYPNPTLAVIGSATGPVGDATHVAAVTVDTKGRVTTLTAVPITGTAPGGSAGGVLDGTYPNPGLAAGVAGAGISESSDVLSVNVDDSTIGIAVDTLAVKTGGITGTQLEDIVVAAGPVGDATHVAAVTIDVNGRVTALSSVAITGTAPGGTAGGVLDGTYPNPGLAASVAGDGLLETSDVLSVRVDGTTIVISADVLGVKAGGIDTTQLANAGPGATGPIGDATHSSAVTIDAKGRVTALSSVAIAGTAPGGSAGGSLAGTYPNPRFNYGKGVQPINVASIIANCLAETFAWHDINNNTALLSSGRLSGIVIPVLQGTPITNLSFCSATTPANGPTHWWFALVEQATLNVIRQSTDQLTAAWAASTPKTVAIDSIPTTAGSRSGTTTVTLTVPTLAEALTSLVAINDSIVVSNASIAAYNGTFTVTNVTSTQIQYVSTSATDSLSAPFPTVQLASGKRVYTTAADVNVLAVMMMTASSAVISNACKAGLSSAIDALNFIHAASGTTGLTGTCPSPIAFGTGTGGVHPWAAIS